MTNLQDLVYETLAGRQADTLNVNASIFPDLKSLAKQVIAYHSARDRKDSQYINETRGKIADYAKEFASKLLGNEKQFPQKIGDDLQKKTRLLVEKDPSEIIVLLSAHQPNLFPYAGVMRKTALMVALSKEIQERTNYAKDVVCLFAFADHDFVHNKWIRSAEIPAPLRRDGVLRFNVKIPQKDIMLPANKVPKPSTETIDQWKNQTKSWINESLSIAEKYVRFCQSKNAIKTVEASSMASTIATNDNEIWSIIDSAQKNSNMLSEFSARLLSYVVCISWDEPVLFANFSDCFKILSKEYLWMLDNVNAISNVIQTNEQLLKSHGVDSGLADDVSEVFPVWQKCSCGSKFRLMLESGYASGRCVRCGSECRNSLEQLKELVKSHPDDFEPRSITMPLALASSLDMSCYIGGVGGLGYLMHTRAIAEKFQLSMPPTPFWHVEDHYNSIELLCAASQVQKLQRTYLSENESVCNTFDGIGTAHITSIATSVLSALETKLEHGLIQKSSVSERDKLLLSNIIKSLRANGCLIDRALNLGVKQMKDQWIDFLENDGRLHVPLKLRASFESESD